MSFVVHGQILADVSVDSILGQPAVGFGRLLIALGLQVRDRRLAERPTLVDVGGELLVRDAAGTLHYLGRLQATLPPIAIEIGPSVALVGLEVELDHARLDALELLRQGNDLTLELTVRARLAVGKDTHVVATSAAHQIGHAAWELILGQLGIGPREP